VTRLHSQVWAAHRVDDPLEMDLQAGRYVNRLAKIAHRRTTKCERANLIRRVTCQTMPLHKGLLEEAPRHVTWAVAKPLFAKLGRARRRDFIRGGRRQALDGVAKGGSHLSAREDANTKRRNAGDRKAAPGLFSWSAHDGATS
jgi:hypothetical protein